MATNFEWDFEPRNVAFKLTLNASFHPSVGNTVVSLPWFDATGALATTISVGPLNTCEADASSAGAGGRGASRVHTEKDLGAFPVTFELVQAIQNGVLPLTVNTSEGGSQVPGEAKIHLGPLLLAGGNALCHETLRPGEPARSKRLRPTSSVSASWTETIGVSGLYRLEVSVSTDMPILAPEMLQRLMPACFRVESVSGLPNESWLPEKCEDVFVQVKPQLSDVTAVLGETCVPLKSASRPHNKSAHFAEPMVWLLGLAPQHAIREWLQHEGLVVEVHDRDPRPKKAKTQASESTEDRIPDASAVAEGEGEEAKAEKEAIHGHGVARFSLGSLLKSETLELALRADVYPNRGDKKRRRYEAMSNDKLQCKTLLGEEGAASIARRAGLDKREDTTNYHYQGTVCTIRAAFAVPVAEHFAIQAAEEKAHRDRWEETEEQLEESNVWAGKSMTLKSLGETAGADGPASPEPTKWAPKATPHRAKYEEVCGPWRRSSAEADEDHKKMAEAAEAAGEEEGAALAAVQEIAKQLLAAQAVGHKEGLASAKEGMDCRYERYGRILLNTKEAQASDREIVKKVINTMRDVNAAILGLDPMSGMFLVRELSEEEQADPHLDLLTGFSILDGRQRIFVIEGLREGHSWQKLLDVIPRGPEAPKLLHNPSIGFGERLYSSFGPRLKQVKVRGSLEALSIRPGLYSWSASSSDADLAGNEAPKQLRDLANLARLRQLRPSICFPKASQLLQMELLYGAYVTDEELEGDLPKPQKKKAPRKQQQLSPTAAASATLSKGDILQQAVDDSELDPSALGGTRRLKSRVTRNPQLNQQNPDYEQSTELARSASVPDFRRLNKELVRQQSDANVKMNDLLGKKRERETPFLDGQEVYLYSSQKLNSAELQKDWMRKHMEGHEGEKMWSYSACYMSQSFDFAGAAPPGVHAHQSSCPNDSYARLPEDDRPVYRGLIHARPKEAYRKPERDVHPVRVDFLTDDPYVENEWFQNAAGNDRGGPVGAKVSFELDQVPHQRRHTQRPFDSQHQHLKPGLDFGPQEGFESVHYHGRPPGAYLGMEALEDNKREKEAHEKKMKAHKTMRIFSQGQTRTSITDLDRTERLLKDAPSLPMRGRLDFRNPESIRTDEEFHELGRPDLEWHARLRENDSSPPYNVTTGAHLRRDPEVGTGLKRASQSGKLVAAPWKHQSTLTLTNNVTNKGLCSYSSHHDFDGTRKPPQSRVREDILWKSASRTGISEKDRSRKEYLRPHHYGVTLSNSASAPSVRQAN
eukprot:TRINITY_DN64749_c0_g1_i1.p1 TRINITY_DN64749_c0_g1~~TRINITY_DN64749_c0_g1_i1.p1  ORF type:complete len:1270 (-),score=259.71 TRINITY_DN64749_c0_g1_i1:157-3966(-)